MEYLPEEFSLSQNDPQSLIKTLDLRTQEHKNKFKMKEYVIPNFEIPINRALGPLNCRARYPTLLTRNFIG